MKLPCFQFFLDIPGLWRQRQPAAWPRHPTALASEASPSLSDEAALTSSLVHTILPSRSVDAMTVEYQAECSL